MEVLIKKITWPEFREMDFPDDENALYELINGEIVKRSSPTVQHQRLVGKLYKKLDAFVIENDLGEVLLAPLDVVLDNENVPQPDLIFVSKNRNFIIDEVQSLVTGTPDLVVEILSPGTMRHDRGEKMELYEQFAIRELWLVDPKNCSIEVRVMQNNRYKLVSFAAENGKIESTVLAGFGVEMADIF